MLTSSLQVLLEQLDENERLDILQSGVRGIWTEVGRTETVKNSANPEWQTSFTLQYHFHEKQVLLLGFHPTIIMLEYNKVHQSLLTYRQIVWHKYSYSVRLKL